jgi:ATP-dependent Clp protease, protease subunit
MRQRLEEIYSKHTGQPVERIHDDSDRDRFFTAEGAVEYALADRVVAGS